MARLPRRVLPGEAHLVVQRAHGARALFRDDADRTAYLVALREAAAAQKVAVHAFGLADDGVRLLVTPPRAEALSRTMQAVGRVYVSAYNRRHGCSGTIWDGRFRCAVVAGGDDRLGVMCWIDGGPGTTSAPHRVGGSRDVGLVDPPEYWALGNTPFEREAAYRTLLVQGQPTSEVKRYESAAAGGWAIGSPVFAAQAAAELGAPLQPRPRGRPRRAG